MMADDGDDDDDDDGDHHHDHDHAHRLCHLPQPDVEQWQPVRSKNRIRSQVLKLHTD